MRGEIVMRASLTKVLIVDDERLIRQGILHYMNWQEEGFEVVGEAANGEEALKLIDALHPDIIITDIVMPVMNGTDLIKYVKEHYPSIEMIVLSSYADFDYVRDTFKNGVVDYILKPKLDGDILLETLKRVEKTAQLKGHVPKQVTGDVPVKAVIEKILKKYHHADDIQTLDAFLGDEGFLFAQLTRSDFSSDEALAQTAIFTGLTTVELERDDRHQLVMCIGTKLALNQAIDEAKMRLLAHRHNPLSIIISTFYDKAKDSITAFDEIKALRNYHFFLSDLPVIHYNHLPPRVPLEKPFDLSIFLTLFKQKKYDVALSYVDEYIGRVKQDYTYQINEVKNLLGNIIFNMVIAFTELKGKSEHFEQKKYQYFNVINHGTTLVACYYHFQQFYDELTSDVMIDSLQQDNISQLLAYIDRHYSEPLSLTDLSAHFHFNPSYLSSYFSQHLNKGFSDYLTDIRINKAKELLNNDDLSIADVGSMVGYQDHSYFCKVFKKKTKQSPSRFRKELIK